ncbi:mariner Mos1 transposase [Trichonephila clavipes]|nr:mariner Mos1 transposase [Trichonephila clavipes]
MATLFQPTQEVKREGRMQIRKLLNNRSLDAPSHRAKPTKSIVTALDWELLAHVAYSPDLAPSDYHLFAALEHALADQRFTSYENVKSWLDD